jgi:hypothetical protein
MRRKIMLAVWLLVPVALLAYHYGPGQVRVAQDRAALKINEAKAFEAKEDWASAYRLWSEALAGTPADQTQTRFQILLAMARTRVQMGGIPEAMQDLNSLLDEAVQANADVNLQNEIRGTLASSQYYVAWLMRLEGAPGEEWMPPSESARQNFRLLAENTKGAKLAEDYEKNLEAVIRLQRMSLEELQGQPLPKNCSGCKNASQKGRSQSESKGKSEPEKSKDARGAGFNDIPKGGS